MDQTAVQNDAGTGRLGVRLCPGSGSVTGRGRGGSARGAWWPMLLPRVERGGDTVLAATGDEGALWYPGSFQKNLGKFWQGMALQQ